MTFDMEMLYPYLVSLAKAIVIFVIGWIVSKWGGFFKDIKFDPLQYGITPKSMEAIMVMNRATGRLPPRSASTTCIRRSCSAWASAS